jgi:plastocyanin
MSARAFAACAAAIFALSLAACGDDDRGGSVEQSGGTDTTGTNTTGTDTTGTDTTGTSTTPSAGGAPVATVDVEETDFAIDPKNARIAKTGVVAFSVKNAGKVVHALEVEGPNGERETDTIQPGKSATLEVGFSKPGTYKWYCPVGDHEARGMKGTVRVAGGGSGTTTDDSGKSGGSGRSGSGKSGSGSRSGAGSSGGSGVY